MSVKRILHAHATLFGLSALVLIGLLLRVWQIERYGLWIDEITTANCLEYSLATILNCHWVEIGSVVHFVATDLVYTLFGRPPLPVPEWLVRSPEVIAGTLTILAAWFASRELLGTRGAWLNALLWTIAPTAIAYSQEARMYAWLLLFSNVSTWFLVYALKRNSWRAGVLFGVTAALNFYSQYLAGAVIASQFLFAIIFLGYASRRAPNQFRRMLWIAALGMLGAGILVVPWLWNRLPGVVYLLTTPDLVRTPLTLNYFANVQAWLVLEQVEIPLAALALFGLEIFGAKWLWQKNRFVLAYISCWLGIIFIFLIARGAGFVSFRHWLVVQPPIFWLLSAGMLELVERLQNNLPRENFFMRPRVLTVSVAILVSIALVPSLAQFYADPFESSRFDDWRGAAQFLRAHAQADEPVIAFGDASVYHKLAFEFYLPRAASSPRVFEPNDLDGNWVAQAKTRAGRAWGIVYARNAETLERLRALGAGQIDLYQFKNLALVSPHPVSASQTIFENTVRLVNLYRAWDAERFALADALLRDDAAGKNLIANPEWATRKSGVLRGWVFGAIHGAVISLDGEPALALTRHGETDNATAQQEIELLPEQLYILHFECRNALTDGAQRLYIFFREKDAIVNTYPSGAGYVCPNNAGWHASAFSFRALTTNTTATVLLSNAGAGDTYWRHLVLTQAPPQ